MWQQPVVVAAGGFSDGQPVSLWESLAPEFEEMILPGQLSGSELLSEPGPGSTQTDRQINKQTDRQAGKQMETDRQRQTNSHTERQTDRDRQEDKSDRQAGRQTHRQTKN